MLSTGRPQSDPATEQAVGGHPGETGHPGGLRQGGVGQGVEQGGVGEGGEDGEHKEGRRAAAAEAVQ